MNDKLIEKIIETSLLIMFVSFMFYGIIKSGEFDNSCSAACSPSRSITPIIDFRNQCLCDEGHGKWRFQDVE